MSNGGRWADLAPRVISAVVMVAVAAGAIWAGGHVFHVFVALIAGGMVWELVRMLAPERAMLAWQFGGLGALVTIGAPYMAPLVALPMLVVTPVVCFFEMPRYRRICAAYLGLILLASYEITALRDHFNAQTLVWLICVVVASDVAGYFAGRMLGGPKFWPKVSPKKTWSGTVAGWIGAGLVGAGFWLWGGAEAALVPLSMVTALAGQLGDIAESAVKRLAGVKDSSNLIPGHGGLLDRFDAMLGAALFVLVVAILFDLPFGAL
ncbi:phosphatidate cytidylyltransferase [Seohaeicola zhoushanensis]|uniref:Phosphatidate cytidylyltransferase n=1 Tax=Seohaeicola zhoushanensis TaxID=1569283 RepID=A0A8J3M8Y9_9RHOB|nr:phosphatidate cytidylyltransferase [Seohaeicola zhoushanensis]GHF56013.1 phosphatidate cytidylyltransferase [Seohaeicola zhoushanensis]